jgi:hypothetical protein
MNAVFMHRQNGKSEWIYGCDSFVFSADEKKGGIAKTKRWEIRYLAYSIDSRSYLLCIGHIFIAHAWPVPTAATARHSLPPNAVAFVSWCSPSAGVSEHVHPAGESLLRRPVRARLDRRATQQLQLLLLHL